MGVNYRAKFGIGYKINKDYYLTSEFQKVLQETDFYDISEFFDSIVGKSNGICYIEEIDNCYEEETDFFVFMKNPFKDNKVKFETKKVEFINFINSNGIVTVDNFDIHGDLYVS
jgi:hypothetical protein